MKTQVIDPALPPIPALSLGSWHTYSRIDVEQGAALVQAALDCGINLFDVAHYWDTPDNEQRFRAITDRLSLARDRYILAVKVWQWTHEEESFTSHLERSLRVLGTDHADIIVFSRPLPEIDEAEMTAEICGLIQRGLARAWAVNNWEAERTQRVCVNLAAAGLPTPVMTELPYNVARRSVVETPAFDELFETTQVRLQPANTLEGGILTGHLNRDRYDPADLQAGFRPSDRNLPRDPGGIRPKIRENYAKLVRIAADFDATPAQAAVAFTLAHPAAGSTVFGATRPEHVRENAGALDLLDRHGPALMERLAELNVPGAGHPLPFDGKKTIHV